MSYALDVDPLAQEQIAALPDVGTTALAEAFAVLQLVPWTGAPYNSSKPDGAMRTSAFGASGLITHLVVEYRQRVDVLVISGGRAPAAGSAPAGRRLRTAEFRHAQR